MTTLAIPTGILLLLLTAHARAATTLAWDPNTDGATVQYRLYSVRAGATNLAAVITHPTAQVTVADAPPGTTTIYYVTAVGTGSSESGPSNKVTIITPRALNVPLNLRRL